MFRKSGSWCSTQVDENGNHIPMFYGKCPRKCKVDDSTKHQKGRSLDGKYILHYSMNSRLNIFKFSLCFLSKNFCNKDLIMHVAKISEVGTKFHLC